MAVGELSGYTVAVTAQRRADIQAALLEERGARVLQVPLVRTTGDPLELIDRATASVLAAPPDLVVVCTATGFSRWWESATRGGRAADLRSVLTAAHVMVRGPKEVAAVEAARCTYGWSGTSATYRDIVSRLCAQSTHGADGRTLRVAVVVDGSGSDAVVTAARVHGFDVDVVATHRWDPAPPGAGGDRLLRCVVERRIDAVTFTSGVAAGYFFDLAERMGARAAVLAAFNVGAVLCAAVGPVTATRLRSNGVRFESTPPEPGVAAMVERLAADLGERRQDVVVDGRRVQVQGRHVLVDGEPVPELADREQAVLRVLAERRGAVVSKRALMAAVWGEVGDEHVVEVTVARLRRRLASAGVSIETVVRRGYRLAVESAAPAGA